MSLEIDIALQRGPLGLSTRLALGSETVAVVGPNGAGKTTLVQAVAGIVAIDQGRIELDGRVLDDVAEGVFVPTAERDVGVVFQDRLLFPHLDALGNVAFGLRVRGLARSDARTEALSWLERVGLADEATMPATELSGGQAQRVALARALASSPKALLLDEPLAGLDLASHHDARRLLRSHLRDFDGPAIVVTHDPVEAALLADRMVVLEDGGIVQEGTIAEVSRHPRSAWVARMAGLNLYRGTATADGSIDIGGAWIVAAEAPVGDVLVTIAPTAVALYRSQPDGSPRNVWALEVVDVDRHGDRVRIGLTGPLDVVAEVTPAALTDLALATGGRVWAAVKATEVVAYRA